MTSPFRTWLKPTELPIKIYSHFKALCHGLNSSMQIALPTQRTIVKYVLIFGISKSCCIWIQVGQLYCCAERRLKKAENKQVHSYDYVKFNSRWPGVWAVLHLVILKSRSVGQCEYLNHANFKNLSEERKSRLQQEISPSKTSRPALGSAQSPIQWVSDFFSGVKAAGTLNLPLTFI